MVAIETRKQWISPADETPGSATALLWQDLKATTGVNENNETQLIDPDKHGVAHHALEILSNLTRISLLACIVPI